MARAQVLAQVVSSLETVGVLPYITQSFILFYMVGDEGETTEFFKVNNIGLSEADVIFISDAVALAFLDEGGDRGVLKMAQASEMLRPALAALRLNNRFNAISLGY